MDNWPLGTIPRKRLIHPSPRLTFFLRSEPFVWYPRPLASGPSPLFQAYLLPLPQTRLFWPIPTPRVPQAVLRFSALGTCWSPQPADSVPPQLWVFSPRSLDWSNPADIVPPPPHVTSQTPISSHVILRSASCMCVSPGHLWSSQEQELLWCPTPWFVTCPTQLFTVVLMSAIWGATLSHRAAVFW